MMALIQSAEAWPEEKVDLPKQEGILQQVALGLYLQHQLILVLQKIAFKLQLRFFPESPAPLVSLISFWLAEPPQL